MGPLSWSAIAAGSAALAESLGLGAAAIGLIVGNKNKNINEFKEWAKTQYPMPETKVIIPSAENALVLSPEYRTVTSPIEYIGYKPAFSNEDSIVISDEDIKENAKESSSPSSPKPNDEKPEEDKGFKKGFKKGLKKGWEHTKKIGSNAGTVLGYAISGGIPLVAGIGAGIGAGYGAGYGLYKLFSSDEKEKQSEEDGVSLKPMSLAK